MATIKAEDLKRAVSACQMVAIRHTAIPGLRSINIKIEGGTAYFEATNLAQCVSYECEAEGEFAALLDTVMLVTRSAVLSSGDVKLTSDGESATISQGRAKWKMPFGRQEGAWPDGLFNPSSENPETISGPEFVKALAVGSYAMEPPGATRQQLQGTFVDGEALVSFDGKRMAVEPFKMAGGYTIPNETIPIILRLFRDAGQIVVSRKEGWIYFLSDTLLFATKTVEQAYPDWRKYLASSQDGGLRIQASKQDFGAAIGRAAAAVTEKGRMPKMKVERVGGELRLSASLEAQENEDFVKAGGDDVSLWINSEYLAQAVDSLGDNLDIRYWPDTHVMILSDGTERKRMVMALRG